MRQRNTEARSEPRSGVASLREARTGRRVLVATADTLLVPTGRAVPAAFARSDGALRFFQLQLNQQRGGAEEILRQTDVREGYCLDLACGDGRLAIELARRSKLQIYAVDADPENVRSARQMIDEAGLCGVRITVPCDDWVFDLPRTSR